MGKHYTCIRTLHIEHREHGLLRDGSERGDHAILQRAVDAAVATMPIAAGGRPNMPPRVAWLRQAIVRGMLAEASPCSYRVERMQCKNSPFTAFYEPGDAPQLQQVWSDYRTVKVDGITYVLVDSCDMYLCEGAFMATRNLYLLKEEETA